MRRRVYQSPRVEVCHVALCRMVAFSDGGQQSPGSGEGGSLVHGFGDHDMQNPDTEGGSSGFWDGDM